MNSSLELSTLMAHTADAVAAVRAGQSLTEAMTRVPGPARAGVQSLAYAVMRKLGWALHVRSRLVQRPPAPWADALILSALALAAPERGATYAPHTLVNQAVEAIKARTPKQTAFVNAVLRRFLRERRTFEHSAVEDSVAQWNHPVWWQDHLRADWPGLWQSLLKADQGHPPMTLRVNARRMDAQDYLAQLTAAGIEAVVLGPQTVQLQHPLPVSRLPGFEAGVVSVQDEAAQEAAPLLLNALARTPAGSLSTGLRVLDACAAPGGKTAHLLELADLDLLALDSDAQRLARVEDTLTRLSLEAELRVADAGEPSTWWDGRQFDAILLDAPCSASGVVRRHPDIVWLRRETDLPTLAKQQRRLLDALWPLLRPGGCLLYATCSVFKIEGQRQFDAFLQQTKGAIARPSSGHRLPVLDNGAASSRPSVFPADGFFYGLVEKSPA